MRISLFHAYRLPAAMTVLNLILAGIPLHWGFRFRVRLQNDGKTPVKTLWQRLDVVRHLTATALVAAAALSAPRTTARAAEPL